MLKHCTKEAPRSLSEILVFELDPRWSREGGEFAPTETAVPMGAVLALDASGRYVPFGAELEPAVEAAEGVEAKDAALADKPCAILISREMEPSEEPQPCVVAKRGCCVAAASLFWLESVGETAKKSALEALAALGIIPKE